MESTRRRTQSRPSWALSRVLLASILLFGALSPLPPSSGPARAQSVDAGIPTAAIPREPRAGAIQPLDLWPERQPRVILPEIARTPPLPALVERRTAPVHLRDGVPAMAPFGHVKFCLINPEHCRETAAPAGPVVLTPALARELSYVNSRVNTRITPRPDRRGIADDDWTLDPRAGDCEDYALTKQAELIRYGWPSGSLRLAIARLPDGEHHTVLIVRTDRGDLVLDNLHAGIRDWQATPYRWLLLQSASSPRLWRRIAAREPAQPPAARRAVEQRPAEQRPVVQSPRPAATNPLPLRGTIAPEPLPIIPAPAARLQAQPALVQSAPTQPLPIQPLAQR